jgi:hypothetical protein
MSPGKTRRCHFCGDILALPRGAEAAAVPQPLVPTADPKAAVPPWAPVVESRQEEERQTFGSKVGAFLTCGLLGMLVATVPPSLYLLRGLLSFRVPDEDVWIHLGIFALIGFVVGGVVFPLWVARAKRGGPLD